MVQGPLPPVLVRGRGVPGVVGGWVPGRGAIPVPTQYPSQGPIFSLFPGLRPTYGQMKAILEVSQINLRYDPQMTLRYDPDMTLR